MPPPPTRPPAVGPAAPGEPGGIGAVLAAIDREALAAGRLVARGRDAFDGDPGRRRAGVAVLRRLGPLLEGLPDDLRQGAPDVAWDRLAAVSELAGRSPEGLHGDVVWRALAGDLPGVPRAAGLWQARHFRAAERRPIPRGLLAPRGRAGR